MCLLMCAALVGCSGMNPKNWGRANNHHRHPDKEGDRRDAPAFDPPLASDSFPHRATDTKGSGVLAGQVLDAYSTRCPGAVITVTPLQPGPQEEPREIVANNQGYFMIEGLTVGKDYKLTAHTRRGGKNLGNTIQTRPPNVVLVITVRDDLYEPAPPLKPKNNGTRRNGDEKPPAFSHHPSRSDDAAPPPRYLAEPDRGRGERPDLSPRQPQAPALLAPTPASPPDLMTREPSRTEPPMVRIPSPTPAPRTVEPAPPSQVSRGEIPVPSCLVTHNRLNDFALPDLSGGVYRWSKNKSKLTLLDFWDSSRPECLHALPHLVELERRYGDRGLHVVGVAYEDGTIVEQQERLHFLRRRHGINYPILLGEGNSCPVRTQLHVHGFPTLILLDEHGQIVWMGEGSTPQHRARLEAEVRTRLGE